MNIPKPVAVMLGGPQDGYATTAFDPTAVRLYLPSKPDIPYLATYELGTDPIQLSKMNIAEYRQMPMLHSQESRVVLYEFVGVSN